MNGISEAAERYQIKLCAVVGCICCRVERKEKSFAEPCCIDSLPGNQMRVIPLCAGHAAERKDSRSEFENLYGKQKELMDECNRILDRS